MIDMNNIYDIIGYVLCSNYRRQVLNSLLTGTKTSRDIADELGFKRPAISKAINELKNNDLVVVDGRKYAITDLGTKVITSINNRGEI